MLCHLKTYDEVERTIKLQRLPHVNAPKILAGYQQTILICPGSIAACHVPGTQHLRRTKPIAMATTYIENRPSRRNLEYYAENFFGGVAGFVMMLDMPVVTIHNKSFPLIGPIDYISA
jgi:hypothetical protein